MGRTLKQVMQRLPAERRKRIEARAAELRAEVMTLRDLRTALDLTQEQLAKTLKIGQDSVSRLEKRTDLMLSTLRNYVAAMGGELTLLARFPDREAVVIPSLGTIAEQEARRTSTRRKKEKTAA